MHGNLCYGLDWTKSWKNFVETKIYHILYVSGRPKPKKCFGFFWRKRKLGLEESFGQIFWFPLLFVIIDPNPANCDWQYCMPGIRAEWLSWARDWWCWWGGWWRRCRESFLLTIKSALHTSECSVFQFFQNILESETRQSHHIVFSCDKQSTLY